MSTSGPARPNQRLTDDGRPMREVLSYARRGSRFTQKQQHAWDRHAADWVIPDEAVETEGFSLGEWFGREAPLIVEIGSGIGEATAALAAARPEANVLAFEVWRPGVATTLALLEEAGATNVRMLSVDAVWALEHLIGPGELEELWTFFPDPWQKKKHHKRRLVDAGFARLVVSRLRPGALWRLATDWPDYAEQIREVLDAEEALEGGPVERWADRPVTKFERRGLAEGRAGEDFTYVRRR